MPFDQENLLEVGVAYSTKAAKTADWDQAVGEAAKTVLDGRKDRSFELRALLLLATPDWCKKDRPLSALFRAEFRKKLGYAVSLIGASVPRAFVSQPPASEEQQPRSVPVEKGFVLIALFSNDLWMTVDSVRDPGKLRDEDARKRTVRRMAGRIRGTARKKHLGLGTSSSNDLFAIFPGPIRLKGKPLISLDMELHDQVSEAFGDSKAVFGGSAANTMEKPEGGFQFQDDHCFQSGLAVALVESDFKMGGAMAHGLKAHPKWRLKITGLGDEKDSKGYVVTEFDRKPAAKRLAYVCRKVGMKRRRPTLGFGVGPYTQIVTPLDYPPEDKQSLRLSRKVTLGFPLTVMDASPDDLLGFAQKAQMESITRACAKQGAVRFLLGFVCIGRTREYDRDDWGGWCKAARLMAQNHAASVPVVYAVVAGEFGETRRRRPRADNFNASFICFTGEPIERSFNRLLQAKLLKSAERIAACQSVKGVMSSAVDLALKAGASNGLICICDPASRKILGTPYGYASEGVDGIASNTRRDLFKEGEGFALNEKLEHWSLEVGERLVILAPMKPTTKTDILSIVAANRLAVFIPNSKDPDFFCDQEAVTEAGTRAQLVIPLVGSKGMTIATLQLTFPDDSHVNREMMRSWIAYAQQVAAILERTAESEALGLFEALGSTAKDIMSRPAPDRPFPEAEIEEFLRVLQCLLEVEYLHLRIREAGQDEPARYRLVAPEGPLAREHKRKRLHVGPNEGSLAHVWEQTAEPAYTETAEETRRQHSRYQPKRDDITPEGRWGLGSLEFEAFCVCRLGDGPDGCLVLHSTKQFFFTQWRIDLVKRSAQHLMILIRKREADFHDQERQVLRDKISALGLLWADTGHDILNLLGSIRWNADLLQRNLAAPAVAEKYFANISQQVDRAVGLLRKHAEQVPLGTAPVRLSKLLEEARQAMVKPWHGDPEFLDQTEEAYVAGNFWVRKALANLLTNAVEHAAERVRGRVWVTVRKFYGAKAAVRIEIGNEGNVIGLEEIQKLRKLGESGKGELKHLGMGISLAELGIATVGGDIDFKPRPGGGLLVNVDLPLIQPAISSTQGDTMCQI